MEYVPHNLRSIASIRVGNEPARNKLSALVMPALMPLSIHMPHGWIFHIFQQSHPSLPIRFGGPRIDVQARDFHDPPPVDTFDI